MSSVKLEKSCVTNELSYKSFNVFILIAAIVISFTISIALAAYEPGTTGINTDAISHNKKPKFPQLGFATMFPILNNVLPISAIVSTACPFGSIYFNGLLCVYVYRFCVNGSSISPLTVSSDINLCIAGL